MALKRAENVLELVGETPLLRLRAFEAPGHARIYAKVESLNPGGSVKDRIALAMLDQAQHRGLLTPGKGCVVEPTSGNTGVGLAMVCAVRRWRCVLVTPEGMPPRRLAVLKAYGATIEQTPFELGMAGAIERAEALLKENPDWFMPMQFSNRDNPAIHRKTTGPEIYRVLKGGIDVFVAGVGTGGTLMGVGDFLKRKIKKLRVVAVEPEGSAVLSGKEAGPHRLAGIGAGFVPAVFERGLVDSILTVSDQDALSAARRLAREEGILAGVSAGANAFAAGQIAKTLPKTKIVVTILCDRGEPYLNDDGEIV